MRTRRHVHLTAARQQLAESEMELARRLASKFYRRSARLVPLDDLIGEAYHAIAYAAGMFDESRGVPFGAYCMMVVCQRLHYAIQVKRTPGLYSDIIDDAFDPVCLRSCKPDDMLLVEEEIEFLRVQIPREWFNAAMLYFGHGYTLEEVGQQLGITRERVRQLLNEATARAAEPGLPFG